MEKQLNTYEHWANLHLDKDNVEKFLINMENGVNSINPSLGEVLENEFLYAAFVWENSNEGHNYWMHIQDKLDEDNEWIII
jgi:hypothetical protein